MEKNSNFNLKLQTIVLEFFVFLLIELFSSNKFQRWSHLICVFQHLNLDCSSKKRFLIAFFDITDLEISCELV